MILGAMSTFASLAIVVGIAMIDHTYILRLAHYEY
jgi:hypothetical protein